MLRFSVCVFSLAALLVLGVGADAQGQKKAKVKNNQMVTGTIKTVDTEKSVLVINQKVKNETVDRELSITEDVEFQVGAQTATGSKGIELIQNRVGASVKVKCDKDVNVLKVTVK